jgi:hypothetical protein
MTPEWRERYLKIRSCMTDVEQAEAALVAFDSQIEAVVIGVADMEAYIAKYPKKSFLDNCWRPYVHRRLDQ